MAYETFTGDLDKPQSTGGYTNFTGELDSGEEQMKRFGKMVGGGLEAGASVLAGLPAQAVGGLRGLGALASGQGLDKANEVMDSTIKSNFGLGAYTPYSEKGKQYAEGLGHALEIPGQKVGDVGGYIGKNIGGLISPEAAAKGENVGRTAGELATNTALALIDPVLGIKGAKALINKPKPTNGLTPAEAASTRRSSKEEALDALDKPVEKYTEFTGQLDPASRSSAQEGLVGPRQPLPEPAPGPREGAAGRETFQAMNDRLGYQEGAASPITRVDPVDSMVSDLTAGGERQRGAAADQAIADRNTAMQQQVATQTGLDFNAAERARQENAPLPPRDVVAPEPLMDRTPEATPIAEPPVVPEAVKPIDTPVEANPAVVNAQKLLDRQETKLESAKTDMQNGKATATDVIAESRALQEAKADLEAAQKKAGVSTDGAATLPKNNGPSFNATTRSQGGGVNLDAITKSVSDATDKIGDLIRGAKITPYDSEKHATEYIQQNIPGFEKSVENKFATPDTPDKVIADLMSPNIKDTPPLWNNVQSGPALTAAKYGNHPLLMSLSRNLNYALAKADFQVRQLVRPLEKNLSHLKTAEMIENNSLFKKEMLQDKQFTPDQLKQAGYSDRQIQAYTMQRAAMDEAFNLQNRNLKALGKPEISKENAYYSSQWHGDWHAPVLDKDGNLAWYIRTTSKAEGVKALAYLRKTMSDTLVIKDGAKPEFRDTGRNPNTPQDVMGAYQDMIGFFKDDSAVSSQIKEALAGYMQQKAYTVAGQDKHFLHKGNIRGFEGDRPWLDAKENAYAGSRSQLNYLTNSIKWSHMQEAISNSKQVMSDPGVVAKFPNAIDYSKAVLARELGIDSNITKGIETALAKMLPSTLNPMKLFDSSSYGVSRGSLFRAGADIKTMTYLQLLGASPAYMVATPLQAVMAAPMWHRILTNEGFSHNVAKTSALALSDTTAGIAAHLGHEMGMTDAKVPMTEFGRKALQYMEDSSMITKNTFDESKGLNEHAAMSGLKSSLGWTIGFPEKIGRMGTFMSLAHHLDASGKYPNQLELFRRASELTDNAMTSFKSFDRPLVVDKLGVAGEIGYTFKSFLFNAFNNLSVAGKMAGKGTVTPLATMIGMYALMGGLPNMPLMNEMDTLWNTTKDLVANLKPDYYSKIQKVDNGLGIKGNLISLLPQTSGFRDLLGYGIPSAASGVQMASRFGMGTGIDPAHPLQGVAPVAQEMKEWSAIGGAAMNPTNSDKALSAIHMNVPPLIQGNMEARLGAFKGPPSPGNQLVYKPNSLDNPQPTGHRRTEADETARKFGVKSLNEARDLETQYISNKESQRLKTAQDGLIEHMMSGIKRGDTNAITNSASEFLKLNPDSRALDSELQKGIIAMNLTPGEQKLMYMKTISQIQNHARLQRMNK